VAAALANPRRRVKRLLLTDDAQAELARRLPPPWRASAERVERNRFQTFLPEDSVHQGAAAWSNPARGAAGGCHRRLDRARCSCSTR
jgi:23S rRNA (guanosine2251-2'-O)-methyltransferase